MALRRGPALWLPPLALMAVIFALSAQPSLDSGLGLVDEIGRKLVHFAEYALLTFLWWRALRTVMPSRRAALAALLVSVTYAASDEYHQSFYPSRDGTAADVVFDTFGVTIGLLLCLWHRVARRPFEPAPQSAADARIAVPASERSPVR